MAALRRSHLHVLRHLEATREGVMGFSSAKSPRPPFQPPLHAKGHTLGTGTCNTFATRKKEAKQSGCT